MPPLYAILETLRHAHEDGCDAGFRRSGLGWNRGRLHLDFDPDTDPDSDFYLEELERCHATCL